MFRLGGGLFVVCGVWGLLHPFTISDEQSVNGTPCPSFALLLMLE